MKDKNEVKTEVYRCITVRPEFGGCVAQCVFFIGNHPKTGEFVDDTDKYLSFTRELRADFAPYSVRSELVEASYIIDNKYGRMPVSVKTLSSVRFYINKNHKFIEE